MDKNRILLNFSSAIINHKSLEKQVNEDHEIAQRLIRNDFYKTWAETVDALVTCGMSHAEAEASIDKVYRESLPMSLYMRRRNIFHRIRQDFYVCIKRPFFFSAKFTPRKWFGVEKGEGLFDVGMRYYIYLGNLRIAVGKH